MKSKYIACILTGFFLFTLSIAKSQNVIFIPSGDIDGVRVGSFYLSSEVITNQDYFTFIQLDGYRKVSLWDQESLKNLNRFKNEQGDYAPRTWKESSPPMNEEFQPVLGISIAEAQAYAKNIGWSIPTEQMWKLAQKVKSDIGPYPWKDKESDSFESIRMVRYFAPAHVWENRFKEIKGSLDTLEKTKAKLSQVNLNASLIREQERKIKTLDKKMKDWEKIPEGLDKKIVQGIEEAKLQLKGYIEEIEKKNDSFLKKKEESLASALKNIETKFQKMALLETQFKETLEKEQQKSQKALEEKMALLEKTISDKFSQMYDKKMKALEEKEKAMDKKLLSVENITKNIQSLSQEIGKIKEATKTIETQIQGCVNETNRTGEELKISIAGLKHTDSNINSEIQKLKQQDDLLSKEDSLLREQIQNALKKADKQEKDITQILQQASQFESKTKELDGKVQELKKVDIEQAQKNTQFHQAEENTKEKFLDQEKNIQKLEEELKNLKLADIEYSKKMLAVNASLESIKQRAEELSENIKTLKQKYEESLLKFREETENANKQISKVLEEEVKGLKSIDIEQSKKNLTLQASMDNIKQKNDEIQENFKIFEGKAKDSLSALKIEAETARKILQKNMQEEMERLSEKITQNQTNLVGIKQETANRNLNLENSVNSLKVRVQTLETSQLDTIRQITLSASEMRRGMMEVGEKIHKLFQSELLFGPLPVKEGEVIKPKEKEKETKEEKKAPEIPIEKIIEEIKTKILENVVDRVVNKSIDRIVKKAEKQAQKILEQVDNRSQSIINQALGEFCYQLGQKYYLYDNPKLTYVCLNMAKAFDPKHEKTHSFLKENWALLHCPKNMLYVPGGKAKLGSKKDPEFPLYEAEIKDFYIDKYETTRKEFALFVQSGAYKADEFWSKEGKEWRGWRIEPSGWKVPELEEENLPVVNVNFYEAQAYSKWAGKRLPTAQEWEYAARGKEGKTFPWGEESVQSGKLFLTNFRQINDPKDGYDGVAPVDAFMKDRSPFGIIAMAGNVSEWCQGIYKIPGSNRKRNIVKGGSFQQLWFRLQMFTTTGKKASDSFNYIGFRCVKDIPEQKQFLIPSQSFFAVEFIRRQIFHDRKIVADKKRRH